jgi:hypothetical protein
MLGYLNKRAEQLLDSLLEPLWQRALRASWPTRLLILVLAVALIVSVTYPAKVRSLGNTAYYLALGAFADPQTPALSGRSRERLRSAADRLALLVRSDLAQLDAVTPWSLAQTMYAIPAWAAVDRERLFRFIRERANPDCSCWTEIPTTTLDRCVFISGWIFAALAKTGTPASEKEIEFLLKEQDTSGWWPTFSAANPPQSASTYTTAWVLIGLQEQRMRGLISEQQLPAIDIAIQTGTTWLLSNREPNARWKPYPYMTTSAVSESISGLAMHALHATTPENMAVIDREWLDNLPRRPISVSEHENSYVLVSTKAGVSIDHFVQIKLPWLLVATVDAFPNGDVIQRARATGWLETQLNQADVLAADTVAQNWWRAEVLYSLFRTLRAVEREPGQIAD